MKPGPDIHNGVKDQKKLERAEGRERGKDGIEKDENWERRKRIFILAKP